MLCATMRARVLFPFAYKPHEKPCAPHPFCSKWGIKKMQLLQNPRKSCGNPPTADRRLLEVNQTPCAHHARDKRESKKILRKSADRRPPPTAVF
jgi:hypothetical protein